MMLHRNLGFSPNLDSNAIKLCNQRIKQAKLSNYVSAVCKDFILCTNKETDKTIITIFCESFPLMDDFDPRAESYFVSPDYQGGVTSGAWGILGQEDKLKIP